MKLWPANLVEAAIRQAIEIAREMPEASAETILQAEMVHHGDGLPETEWVQTRWLAESAESDAKRLAPYPEYAVRCAALHQLLAGRLPAVANRDTQQEDDGR